MFSIKSAAVRWDSVNPLANNQDVMVEATISSSEAPSATKGFNLSSLLSGGISLAMVNRVLGVLTVLAVVYFVVSLLGGVAKLIGVGHHIHQLETSHAEKSVDPSSGRDAVKPAPADAALGNRNIFMPAGAVVSSSGAGNAGAAGTSSYYKLVGISEAKDPGETYVMIENSQTKLTYFLQYGQPVEGLELEKILDDKVIVKIGGNAVELE